MPLPRMRTAEGVLDIIRTEDPDTEVTLHYLRQLIASGEVPHTPAGRKKLVNADAVIDYIAAGQKKQMTEPSTGGIRRVSP